MKMILEFLGFIALIGEALTLYTFVACVQQNLPFPAWFAVAIYILSFAVLSGVMALVIAAIKSFKRKKLGFIKIKNGKIYYKK